MKVAYIANVISLVLILYLVYLVGFYDGAVTGGIIIVKKEVKKKPHFTTKENVVYCDFRKLPELEGA